jgi:cobalt-zinc-cadmium efflux system membrane fusion protein
MKVMPAWFKWTAGLVLGLLSIGAAGYGYVQFQRNHPSEQENSGGSQPGVQRVDSDTLTVPSDVAKTLGLDTAVAGSPTRYWELPPLTGCLAVDPNRQARVHSRFAGEVVALGTINGTETDSPFAETGSRPLRVGDTVKAGQLLAVVWSKDLGEKKSELVDALSQLRVNRDTLQRYKSLTEGVIAQRQLREAERAVEASVVAVARAEATLRTWRVGDEEIKAVTAEADRLARQDARPDPTTVRRWARVEVRAPMAGALLEKNTTIGDVIDTKDDLYRVADLGRLAVWAYLYEDDLPTVQALERPTPWRVRLPSRPDLQWSGKLEQIGEVIDPNQRTALVRGSVDNPRGELKVGQFITATIEVPPDADVVEVPTTALVEDGKESILFVQPDPKEARFTRRPVSVVRRYQDVAYVRGAGHSVSRAWEPVKRGTRVVTSGAVQLNAALQELPLPATAASAKANKQPARTPSDL